MKFTYYGHSCFAVQTCGKTLLFDPFISPNPLAAHIDLKSIKADFILISHGHEDHVADAVALAKQTGAQVICNFEIYLWLGKQGVTRVHPMNHGGRAAFDFGIVKFVSAIHSSMLPDGSFGGNPGGFVVETREGAFYYSGDTALTVDMRLIAESTQLKFAVLCIGDNFTMGPEDAVKAAALLRCSHIVGVHYDTFPPIQLDKAQAVRIFQHAEKNLYLVPIGNTIEL